MQLLRSINYYDDEIGTNQIDFYCEQPNVPMKEECANQFFAIQVTCEGDGVIAKLKSSALVSPLSKADYNWFINYMKAKNCFMVPLIVETIDNNLRYSVNIMKKRLLEL